MEVFMLNVLLNGAKGRMGTAITNYIKELPDFNLLYSIDKDNSDMFHKINKKPDLIIDFSTPSACLTALNYAVENLVPIIIATTGFSQTEEMKIKEFSEAIPIFKSSNMSYGIALFSNMSALFAKKLKNYDIEIIEKHHRNKADAPSGTAIMVADNICRMCKKKYKYVFSRTNDQPRLSNHEIGFSSVRGGSLIGEHSVLFLNDNEKIEITHTAYSRNIYVEGTIRAARFILTKKNGLYSMKDLL